MKEIFLCPDTKLLCSDMQSGLLFKKLKEKGSELICDCDNHLRKHKGNSQFLGILLLNILEDNFPLLPCFIDFFPTEI